MMQNLTVFQWQGENQLWDAILQNLDAAIDGVGDGSGSEIEARREYSNVVEPMDFWTSKVI